MKTLTFKTNMLCQNCVAKVAPLLDKKEEIISWSVDTNSPDKVLTVQTETLSVADIQKVIKRTGFEATEL